MKEALEKAVKIIVQVADPDRIILFGSRTRGDAKKESDFDVCVLKKGVEHRRKLAQRIYRSLYGIGAPVDVIVETPEKFLRRYSLKISALIVSRPLKSR